MRLKKRLDEAAAVAVALTASAVRSTTAVAVGAGAAMAADEAAADDDCSLSPNTEPAQRMQWVNVARQRDACTSHIV